MPSFRPFRFSFFRSRGATGLPLPAEIRILIASAFVIALGYGLVAPVLPQFAQSFDVGAAAASAVVSAFALTRLLFAPAGGALMDRVGARPVYLAGLLIVALSTAATAFAQDYWQLIVYRGLGGIGSTMFTVSAMAMVLKLAPPSMRGTVSGAYASAFLLGGIAGPVLGGLLAGYGLRVPFFVYAGSLLVAAAVVYFRLKPAGSGGEDPLADTGPPLGLRQVLRDSAYRASLVSSFANGWNNFGIRVALVPIFAGTALAGGPESAGTALAVFAAGHALALTFSGRLADSHGRRPLVLAGLLVSAAATGLTGLATSVPLLLAASFAAGCGAGLTGPAQQAAVGDVTGGGRGGRPLAVFQMTSDAGAIAGPVLAGLLADGLSFGWAFAVSGAVSLLAVAAWLGARETLPPSTDSPAPDSPAPGPAPGSNS